VVRRYARRRELLARELSANQLALALLERGQGAKIAAEVKRAAGR
jgi:hypothetical protein